MPPNIYSDLIELQDRFAGQGSLRIVEFGARVGQSSGTLCSSSSLLYGAKRDALDRFDFVPFLS